MCAWFYEEEKDQKSEATFSPEFIALSQLACETRERDTQNATETTHDYYSLRERERERERERG